MVKASIKGCCRSFALVVASCIPRFANNQHEAKESVDDGEGDLISERRMGMVDAVMVEMILLSVVWVSADKHHSDISRSDVDVDGFAAISQSGTTARMSGDGDSDGDGDGDGEQQHGSLVMVMVMVNNSTDVW